MISIENKSTKPSEDADDPNRDSALVHRAERLELSCDEEGIFRVRVVVAERCEAWPSMAPYVTSCTVKMTLAQAQEVYRKLGEALTDERVRRAELERAKQP